MEMFPAQLLVILNTFPPACTSPPFAHACDLLVGTVLTQGRRTVASTLRAIGRQHDQQFTTYYRVLNHVAWSPSAPPATFHPTDAPVLLVMDSTLERRRGRKIALPNQATWSSRKEFSG